MVILIRGVYAWFSYKNDAKPHIPQIADFNWSAAPTALPPIDLPPAPDDPEILAQAEELYATAKAEFDNQEWKSAYKLFNEVLQLNPRHAPAYNFRGAAYRRQASETQLMNYLKHQNGAILDFSRGIAADPTWWRNYNNRAGSYSNRAKIEPLRSNRQQWEALALADLERAATLAPHESSPHCNLAICYSENHQCELALEHAEQCTHKDLNYFRRIAAYQCQGDYETALALINEMMSVFSMGSDLYWLRANIYFDMGEYDLAWADYEKGSEIWQGNFLPGTLNHHQAEIAYEQGNYEQAKTLIKQGRGRTWLDWGKPYYYLGMIYLHEGEEELAWATLTWAEQTLDEGTLLDATRAALQEFSLSQKD